MSRKDDDEPQNLVHKQTKQRNKRIAVVECNFAFVALKLDAWLFETTQHMYEYVSFFHFHKTIFEHGCLPVLFIIFILPKIRHIHVSHFGTNTHRSYTNIYIKRDAT